MSLLQSACNLRKSEDNWRGLRRHLVASYGLITYDSELIMRT